MKTVSYRQAPVVLIHPGETSGNAQYRVIYPSYVMAKEGFIRPMLEPQPYDNDALTALSPDIVIWNGQPNTPVDDIARYRFRLKSAFMVYEMDDLMDFINDARINAGIRKAINSCDVITVSTEDYAEIIRRKFHARNIRVTGNLLPKDYFTALCRMADDANAKRENTGKIRVGCYGKDFPLTKISPIADDGVQFVLFGERPNDIDSSLYEFREGFSLSEFHLDMVLIPTDNAIRANIAIMEAGALDVPVLAAHVQGDVPAIAITDSGSDAWVNAIRASVGHKTGIREWIAANGTIDNRVEEYFRLWTPDNAEIFRPVVPKGVNVMDTVPTKRNRLCAVTDDISFTPIITDGVIPDVLYVQKGTPVTEDQMDRLRAKNAGAIMPMHNSGIFPRVGQFMPVDGRSKEAMDVVCRNEHTNKYGRMTLLSGPCVLLKGDALAAVGWPRLDYDSVDASLADWSLRAASLGFATVCAYDVFVGADKPGDTTEMDQKRINARFKGFKPRDFGAEDDPKLADFRESLELGYYRNNMRAPIPVQQTYQEWVKVFDSQKYEILEGGPEIVIIITGKDQAALESVVNQSYKNWTAYLPDQEATENPTDPRIHYGASIGVAGQWSLTLDSRNALHVNALAHIAVAIDDNPNADLIFGDYDYLDNGVRQNPMFFNGYDYERLLADGDLGPVHISCIGGNLFQRIESLMATHGIGYRQRVLHISRILSHMGAPKDPEAASNAVIDHLARLKIPAMVTPNAHPKLKAYNTVQFGVPEDAPLVSIVVHGENPDACVHGILANTAYPNYVIHTDAEIKNDKVRNSSVPESSLILYMRSDTRIIDPRWLNPLVGSVLREDVMTVCPRIINENGIIQSFGISKDGPICAGGSVNDTGYRGNFWISHEAFDFPHNCYLVNDNHRPGAIVACAESTVVQLGPTAPSEHDDNDDSYTNSEATQSGAPIWPAPWADTDAKPISIVINGLPDDLIQEYHDGRIAFAATSIGPVLKITVPTLDNVRPWDIRTSLAAFMQSMTQLSVSRVILRNVGNGSLDILGFLSVFHAQTGIPVEYRPMETFAKEDYCPRNMLDCDGRWEKGECQSCIYEKGTPSGYVDIEGWRGSWQKFRLAIGGLSETSNTTG